VYALKKKLIEIIFKGEDVSKALEFARKVLESEIRALEDLNQGLDHHFESVIETMLKLQGCVIVTGVGKAGIIGKKITATLASTGTKSIWLDPVNALHGDLGMVGKDDLAILISNSGSSAEILLTAQALQNLGVKCVALTKHEDTPLAQICDLLLPLGEHEEAGPLKLAPSASTTAMLAIGDALALTLQKLKNFTELDYAKFHPAGALGRRLMPVKTLMRTGNNIVIAKEEDTLPEILASITKARCGLCMVVDDDGVLLAVYSDGDFRRDWSAGQKLDHTEIKDLMHLHCKYIESDALVGDALAIMHEYKINALPVVDKNKKVCGLLDIQDVV